MRAIANYVIEFWQFSNEKMDIFRVGLFYKIHSDNDVDWLTYIRPFQTTVWICVLVIGSLMFTSFAVSLKIRQHLDMELTGSESAFMVFHALVTQGYPEVPLATSKFIVFFAIYMFANLMWYCHSSTLFSHLVIRLTPKPFTNLETLYHETDYIVATREASTYTDYFKVWAWLKYLVAFPFFAINLHFRVEGQSKEKYQKVDFLVIAILTLHFRSWRKNARLLCLDHLTCLENTPWMILVNTRCCLAGISRVSYHFTIEEISRTGNSLTISKSSISKSSLIQTSECFRLQKMHESGVLQNIKEEYTPYIASGDCQSNEAEPLTMKKLAFPFIFLMIFWIVACVIVSLELKHFKRPL